MELNLKTILSSDGHSVKDNRFYSIDDKYLIGDSGILIDRTGQLLWAEQWEHSILLSMAYLRNSNVLLTDRHAMPGPCTMSLGVCAIDMNSGKYLWKHWYEDSYEERIALRKGKEAVKQDIRLIHFGGGVTTGEYILTNGFKIHIKTGEFEFLPEGHSSQSFSITEKPVRPADVIHDAVNYIGSIKNFEIPEDSNEKWGEKFSWYQRVISEAKGQKIFDEIKIYDIVDFFDNNLLITGKDMKLRKDSIWILRVED